ncbi:transglycosylase SLT domain-containing protein [Roseicella aquatilis]|uniref:Lytic transglycosylase domain-containing protein n=1 Tax=Roseicella aquatilis TaxID=2527868 RepID=A0A4R4DBS4_9PROT|nr:transglycosylase SLT domain-containing protein [Roseicella aquatilis]TCZ57972.1 lytic transglycosylase domain-containing protein [Roseicella aquatilis]
MHALAVLLSALAAGSASAQQGLLCRSAIEAAERERGIPTRLMQAIARVESGRKDPATGAFHPWPWTVNAEGVGSFHPSKEAAIAYVQAMQARGVRSIDVGCMQVNLRHHPNAFASLEEAFEPLANARYAARFLSELQQSRGGWQRATAGYHSATAELGEPYRARVEAVWAQEQNRPTPPVQVAAMAAPAVAAPPAPPQAALPGGGGGIGGGFLTSNRVTGSGTGSGSIGRGLDAYRSMPIPLVGRIATAAPIPSPSVPPSAGSLGTRRLF